MTKVNCKGCAQDDCSYFGMNNLTKCVDYKPLNPIPQRKWVGLTDDDITNIYAKYDSSPFTIVEIVEAKLKEKNT